MMVFSLFQLFVLIPLAGGGNLLDAFSRPQVFRHRSAARPFG